MAKKLINIFAPAAVLIVALGFSSCEREEQEPEYQNSVSPKESAIYKHIASHEKERTRTGEEIRLDEEMSECDTYTSATIAY